MSVKKPTVPDVNAAFGVPSQTAAAAPAPDLTQEERIAALRAKAKEIVAESFDEDALLKRFVAEEQAARETAIIDAMTAADGTRGTEGVGSATAQGFPRKYIELTIYKGQSAEDSSYVPVSVNGFAWKITRGEKVMVPSVVAETLENAIQEITIKSEGGLVTRPAHRFPFQVLREVSEEQYLSFVAKCRTEAKASLQRV